MTVTTEIPFTLAARFLAVADAKPNRIAIEEGDRLLSYADLRGRASALACYLQDAGVGPDTLVGLCGVRSLDYIVATLAVSLAGGAYLPIAPDTPRTRLDAILEAAQPRLILTSADAQQLFAARDGRVETFESLPARAFSHAEPPPCAATPDSLAYVMFTSGSTGAPKGAAIPQTAVVQLVCEADYVTLDDRVRVLLHSALTFDAVTFELWGALLNGGTVVVMPAGKPRLQDYADILRDKAIDTVFFTLALFRELVDWNAVSLAPVRQLLTGGEVITADHVRRALRANPGLKVVAVYGPTECTTFATACAFTDAAQVPDPLPLGLPIQATEVRLLNSEGSRAALGEIGEIHIGGPRIAREYLGRPDLTEAAFIYLEDGARFYRTGDLAVYDAAGDLFFTGRRDRQIKLRGYRVELEEIEGALRAHPSVSAAAVLLLDRDGARDPMLVAYVIPDPTAAPDADADVVEGNSALTGQWRDVYSELLYRSLATPDQGGADPTFNTAGWTSSYDGRHIDDVQMLEQVDRTVERVLRIRPRRVLEIGCGTGMLLFRIARHCDAYVGTDFSQIAIDYVARQVAAQGLARIVSLACCPADDLPEPPDGGFDMVIINSVTEHFPSIDYLDMVLRQLRGALAVDAHVFVGDNRNYTLLPLFHASVQLFRSDGDIPLRRFALQVAQAVAEERQLTIDPAYFLQLGALGYQCRSLQCRRGHTVNEMTAFRFDAMLRFGSTVGSGAGAGTEAGIATAPPTKAQPELDALLAKAIDRPVAIGDVRNARNRGGDLLIDAVDGRSPFTTVGELRRAVQHAAQGISPEAVWLAAEAHGIAAEIRPRIGSTCGTLDLWLAPLGQQPAAWSAPARPLHSLANHPAAADRLARIAAALRPYLAERLPDYAMPSFIVALPRFMTTAHGKIDMAALPLPERLRRRRSEAPAAGVEDDIKTQLRRCWEAVLGLYDIDDDEDFFALGGTSLSAVRMVAEFRTQSGILLSPAHVFERPTLAGLADRVREMHALAPPRLAYQHGSRGLTRRDAVRHHRSRADAGSPL